MFNAKLVHIYILRLREKNFVAVNLMKNFSCESLKKQ